MSFLNLWAHMYDSFYGIIIIKGTEALGACGLCVPLETCRSPSDHELGARIRKGVRHWRRLSSRLGAFLRVLDASGLVVQTLTTKVYLALSRTRCQLGCKELYFI